MSIRVQVILGVEEAAKFKAHAKKDAKSLSAWLRDAARKMLEADQRRQPLSNPSSLKSFFQKCNEREKGIEPDWEEQKRLILEGFQAGNRP